MTQPNRRKLWVVLCGFLSLLLAFLYWYRHDALPSPYAYKLPILDYEKDLGAGLADVEKRLETDPNSSQLLATAADLSLTLWKRTGDSGALSKAQKLANESVGSKADHVGDARSTGRLVLAKIEEYEHHFTEAIASAETIRATTPKNLEALKILATANLALGRMQEAVGAADLLVELYPKTGTLALRGLMYISQGRDEEGVFDLERSFAVEDLGEGADSAWARLMLGRYYLKNGQINLASKLFQEADRISPRLPLALDLRAQAAAAEHKFEVAEGLFDEAFQISKQAIFLRHAAELDFKIGKTQLAQDRFTQAEKLIRNDLAINQLGHRAELVRILLSRNGPGDTSEALRLITAESESRKDSETFFLLAQALRLAGHGAEALHAMNNALRSGVHDADLYLLMRDLNTEAGNGSRAQFYLHLADRANPDHSSKFRFR